MNVRLPDKTHVALRRYRDGRAAHMSLNSLIVEAIEKYIEAAKGKPA
jgi:predicted HicB family RNase H-like nuclease